MTERKIPTNLGFLPPPDISEEPKQWLGGTIPYQVLEKDGDWKQYRRLDEVQKFPRLESFACVSFSGNASDEAQINRMIVRDELNLELLKPWLDDTGFFSGSDRALAKMSNTSPSGNTQMRVGDTMRKMGIIPQKLWPNQIPGKDFNWDEFYAPIPKEVTDWGLKFLEYFDVQYERLPDMKPETLMREMKHAPIWIAIGICPGYWDRGIVQSCSATPVHAIILDSYEALKKWYEYDSYEPFGKELAWNYRFYYPYKLVVTAKPSILKKKELNENDMPEFIKVKGLSTVYQVGADGLNHPIANEGFMLNLYGGWDKVKVNELEVIPTSSIGSKVGELSWAAEIINNILGMQKKLGAGIVKKYPQLGSSVDPSSLSLTIQGALLALVPIIIVIARGAGLDLAEGELVSFIEAVTTALSAGIVAYGLIRKFIKR